MRSLLAATLIISATLSKAQDVLTVYYCVPPDMGCDGYCAIDLPGWNACTGGGGAYNYEPWGCVDFGSYHTDGDTLFIGICNDPCLITIADDLGGMCVCQLSSLIPTGIPDLSMVPVVVRTGQGLRISVNSPLNAPAMGIIDAAGRTVRAQGLPDGSSWDLPISGLSQGPYLLTLESEGRRCTARF